MKLKDIYYVYPSIFTKKWCDDIISFAKNKEIMPATVGTDLGPKLIKESRVTNVSFFDEKWIYKPIHRVLQKANEDAKWNFQFEFTERVQYTVYSPGHFYNWHQDSWDEPYQEEGPNKGLIRKLSASIILNDETEYEGGELIFKEYNLDNGIHILGKFPKGTAIVFPSFIYHKVQKVTSGKRISLVSWTCGDPFK